MTIFVTMLTIDIASAIVALAFALSALVALRSAAVAAREASAHASRAMELFSAWEAASARDLDRSRKALAAFDLSCPYISPEASFLLTNSSPSDSNSRHCVSIEKPDRSS